MYTGSGRRIWKKLLDRYERTGDQAILRLQEKMEKLTLSDGGDPFAFFSEAKDLVRKVAEHGERLEDKRFARVLLAKLPERYATVKALVSQTEELTSELVKQVVQSEWETRHSSSR